MLHYKEHRWYSRGYVETKHFYVLRFTDNEKKNQLNALLLLYNLSSIVDFPTRLQNKSATIIDNIFIDINRMDNYTVKPLFNDLSDHDAQLLTFNNIKVQLYKQNFQYIRSISKNTIADFLIKLSYETWDTTFTGNDINIMFNSFLNTYLRIFYCSFPLKKIQQISNNWITARIKTSCNHKRELHLMSRNSYNPDLKKYYKLYCKILINVIKEAKRLHYDGKIKKSNNKKNFMGYYKIGKTYQ
jgi:hypothetical protein